MNVLQKRNKYVKPHIPRSANQLTIMKRNVRKSLMKVVTMLKFHTVRKCHKNTVLTTLCLNVIRNPNKNATIILYPNVTKSPNKNATTLMWKSATKYHTPNVPRFQTKSATLSTIMCPKRDVLTLRQGIAVFYLEKWVFKVNLRRFFKCETSENITQSKFKLPILSV